MSWLFFWLFVLIQAGDVWTTRKGLQLGGEEGMPLGRVLFDRIGFWPTILLVKGLGIAAALLVTLLTASAYWFTAPLSLFGLYVLWRNWQFIKNAS